MKAALKRQQEELREMYMEPLEKLRLEKHRREERQMAAAKDAEMGLPEGINQKEYRGVTALFDIFEEKGKIKRSRMGSLFVKLGIDSTERDISDALKVYDKNGDELSVGFLLLLFVFCMPLMCV